MNDLESRIYIASRKSAIGSSMLAAEIARPREMLLERRESLLASLLSAEQTLERTFTWELAQLVQRQAELLSEESDIIQQSLGKLAALRGALPSVAPHTDDTKPKPVQFETRLQPVAKADGAHIIELLAAPDFAVAMAIAEVNAPKTFRSRISPHPSTACSAKLPLVQCSSASGAASPLPV